MLNVEIRRFLQKQKPQTDRDFAEFLTSRLRTRPCGDCLSRDETIQKADASGASRRLWRYPRRSSECKLLCPCPLFCRSMFEGSACMKTAHAAIDCSRFKLLKMYTCGCSGMQALSHPCGAYTWRQEGGTRNLLPDLSNGGGTGGVTYDF